MTPIAAYGAPEAHDGVVAEIDGELTGAVTFVRGGDDWEIVTLISTVESAGVGREMLEEVRRLARRSGATRLWLTTDDADAAGFYEHLGMTRTRTHEDFVEVVRRVSRHLARRRVPERLPQYVRVSAGGLARMCRTGRMVRYASSDPCRMYVRQEVAHKTADEATSSPIAHASRGQTGDPSAIEDTARRPGTRHRPRSKRHFPDDCSGGTTA